jgi:adenylate kinase family enzyme
METIMSSRRIVVVGTSCSGKSTLAKNIAGALSMTHIELDSLFWLENWTEASNEVFFERVASATKASSWVVDGNYRKVRDLVWSQANMLIWLDYSFPIVFARALHRTLRRSITRESLWSGNKESLRKAFFSRDSILLWVLQSYGRHKREYPKLLAQPEYAHLKVLHFRNPAETESYLSHLR